MIIEKVLRAILMPSILLTATDCGGKYFDSAGNRLKTAG
jgi:hypothetical protein